MKIDVHTHILPPDIPKFAERYGYGPFVHWEKPTGCQAKMVWNDGRHFRDIESNCWDASARRLDCEESGVDLQVLSTVPVMFSYHAKPEHGLEIAKFLNDHLAGVVAGNPKCFVGLGTLPLQNPELAVRELERCVRELKFKGVQIGSHVNAWNLDEPALFPVFQAAQDLGAAVFVHPWDMMGMDRMTKYWLPWLVGMPAETSLAICSVIFGGVLERLPRLRIAFAHGGGSFAGIIGRIEHGFLSRPDLCAVDCKENPRKYLGRIFVDSLVHDVKALRLILEVFGESRVMLGSDYPFPLGESTPGATIEQLTGLTPALRELLFSKNALEWLG